MDPDVVAELAYLAVAVGRQLDRVEPWRRDALCREPGYPVGVFFPGPGGRGSAAAVAVCARCLVRAECATFALSDPWASSADGGVWGGTTGRERRQVLATRTAA